MLTVTVSQLNRYIRAVLEEDRKLADLYVRGEIANFTRHYQSGHCYFTLRDAGGAIRTVLFKSHAQELRFEPENGMSVLVRAHVGVYERDGVYQLYATDLVPEGAGALAVAFRQVKERLEREGLFDERHKRPLPPLPARIGVVTSETGAVLQDITQVLTRRYPLATLVLAPALVQGKEAPASLIRALQALDAHGNCDVILLARGGGSEEDLACFNDETLARAVFAAQTPVISAVGHETDHTICDFVADRRAPTPSAAAELAAPDMALLRRQLAQQGAYLRQSAQELLLASDRRLQALAGRRSLRTPMDYLMKKQERLDFLSQSLYNKKCIFMRDHSRLVAQKAALLDSLSPLRVLQRGYCAAFRGESAISSAAQAEAGAPLTVRFHDGTVQTEVCSIALQQPEKSRGKHGNE